MLLECTHCNYSVCLLYFRVSTVVSVLVQSLSCSPLSNCVYSYGMCIYNAVSGLVCCIPLYCCDTTPTSSTSFSINLTWKAACLCPFVGVLQRVLKVEHCVTNTGGVQPTPILQCKDSPFGPSAWIEHPWTTAVTPERRGLLTGVHRVELRVISKYWWQ